MTPNVGVVTEQEVQRFYQANRARFEGEGASREQVRAKLQSQRLTNARQAYIQKLQSQANVVVYLKEPPVTRVEVPLNGGIARGGAKAPVTIGEFTDFHCPFCKRAQSTMEEVLAKFGDKVKHVHRGFPIERLHPQAPRAHLAARCANEQAKFWSYHDKLYAGPARSNTEQLETYARDVGLDIAAFEQCLSSGKYHAAVQNDIQERSRLGVTGTPTFFINGRLLVGAHPLSKFVEIVEDELARAGERGPEEGAHPCCWCLAIARKIGPASVWRGRSAPFARRCSSEVDCPALEARGPALLLRRPAPAGWTGPSRVAATVAAQQPAAAGSDSGAGRRWDRR